MFSLVIGTLRYPLSYLDELTPHEIGLLIVNYYEEQRNHYDMISNCVAFGYASAKKGKKIKMFKEQKKTQIKKISEGKRDSDKQHLLDAFAKNGETK